LAEIFRKKRELYPESELQTNTIFMCGDKVITEWTLQTILTEPFYGGLKWRIPVSLHGASIVRTENGKITDGRSTTTGLPRGAPPWLPVSRNGLSSKRRSVTTEPNTDLYFEEKGKKDFVRREGRLLEEVGGNPAFPW